MEQLALHAVKESGNQEVRSTLHARMAEKKRGQIWKLTGNKLELYTEPNDADLVDNCDNLSVAPWGDLVLCEDGKGDQFLDVITPEGKIFKLAKNAKSSGEFAGVCFSLMDPLFL